MFGRLLLDNLKRWSKLDKWLMQKVSESFASFVHWAILVALPIVFVLPQWKYATIVAGLLSAIFLLHLIFGIWIELFGSEELYYAQGLRSQVKENGLDYVLKLLFEYMIIIVCNYGVLYSATEQLWPGSFLRSYPSLPILDFLYFSLVTLVTLGPGDIAVICPYVKALVMSQIASGILLVFTASGVALSQAVDSKRISN